MVLLQVNDVSTHKPSIENLKIGIYADSNPKLLILQHSHLGLYTLQKWFQYLVEPQDNNVMAYAVEGLF